MTEKSTAKADFITSLILLAFGIAIVVMSIQMPMATDANQSKFSAPGIVPGFIGAMLSFLSLAMLLRSLKHGGASDLAPKPGAVKRLFAQETTARILKTTGLCVAYALLLGKLWFPIPTFFFAFAFITLFEYDFKSAFKPQIRKVIMAFAIALISTALVTLVFQGLFLVNLP